MKSFLEKLKYKEGLTLLVTSITCIYFSNLILNYNSKSNSIFLLLILSIITNHIIYNIEHKKNNTYAGRVIITFLFFLLIAVYQLLVNHVNLFTFNNIVVGIILIGFIELIIEPITKLFPNVYFNLTKIKLIYLSLLFLTIFIVQNKFVDNSFIYWKKLSWNDFNYKPNKETEHDAGLTLDIIIEFDNRTNKYMSHAISINELSFKKKKFKSDIDLLRHEQYHFDLAKYYSNKMNEYLNSNDINSKFDYINKHSEIRNIHNKMQEQYDNETNYSLNVKQQKNWEVKIDSLLNLTD